MGITMAKTCMQCGRQLSDQARFCTQCGAPQQVWESHSTSEIQTPATPPPIAVPSAMPTTPPPRGNTATKKHPHRLWYVVLVALVLIIAGIALYLFTTGPLSHKTIPSFEGVTTAADAEARLKSSGISVTRRQQFSRYKQGTFLGLDGLESGQQIDRSTEVTIVESLGPGVPKGTVGSTQEQAINQVKDMGVPVTVVPVTSTQSSGTIIKTSPEDGKAVEQENGITLAVASADQGIPLEIAGMELNKAQQQLEAQGFTITTQARVASKDNIGKVVGANPEIGTVTNGGNVTLYYGVDAKGLKESMVRMNPGVAGKTYTDLRAMLGTWCNVSGDCHTITALNPETADDENYPMSVKLDEAKNKDAVGLSVFPMGGDAGSMLVDVGNQAMERTLIMGDSGAVEIYDNDMRPTCGTSAAISSRDSYCKDGVITPYSGNEYPTSSGLTIGMNDYVVVIPVGTDIAALKKQGYFAEGIGAAPDDTRPYILVRDASLYDASERTYTYSAKIPMTPGETSILPNPFVPTVQGNPIEFRPAPSAESAYYYVENPINLDALAANGTQVCDADSCNLTDDNSKNEKSAEEPTRSAVGLTCDEIFDDLQNNDFSIIAGTYCDEHNMCFEITKDGKLNPVSGDISFGPDGQRSTQLHLNDRIKEDWGKNVISLGAPNSDYRCKSNRTGKSGQGADECQLGEYTRDEIVPATWLLYYPSGSEISKPDPISGYPSDEIKTIDVPCIQRAFTPLSSPTTDSVFYLQQ